MTIYVGLVAAAGGERCATGLVGASERGYRDEVMDDGALRYACCRYDFVNERCATIVQM